MFDLYNYEVDLKQFGLNIRTVKIFRKIVTSFSGYFSIENRLCKNDQKMVFHINNLCQSIFKFCCTYYDKFSGKYCQENSLLLSKLNTNSRVAPKIYIQEPKSTQSL